MSTNYQIVTAGGHGTSRAAIGGGAGSTYTGQSFLTVGAGKIATVSAWIGDPDGNNPSDTVTAEIFAADGSGHATGSSLGTSNSVSAEGSTLETNGHLFTFVFTTPVAVSAATSYVVVFYRSAAVSGTTYAAIFGHSTFGSYADGLGAQGASINSGYSDSGGDFYCEINVTDDAVVPCRGTAGITGFGMTGGNPEILAQSFVANVTGEVPMVSIYTSKIVGGTASDSVIVAIQADSAGVPSGTDLASGTGSVSNTLMRTNDTYGNVFTVTLSSPAPVTNGTKYWLIMRRTTPTGYPNAYNGFGQTPATSDPLKWWDGSAWQTGNYAIYSVIYEVITAVNVTATISAPLAATFSLPASSVTLGAECYPSVLAATFSLPVSSVFLPDAYFVIAQPVVATFSTPSVTVVAVRNVTASPSVLACAFSTASVTVTAERYVTIDVSAPLALAFAVGGLATETGDLWQPKYADATGGSGWSNKY